MSCGKKTTTETQVKLLVHCYSVLAIFEIQKSSHIFFLLPQTTLDFFKLRKYNFYL